MSKGNNKKASIKKIIGVFLLSILFLYLIAIALFGYINSHPTDYEANELKELIQENS